MKKISHKERIAASKNSIVKTKKLESRRMNPKLKRGLSISTAILATGGIIAGATIGILSAANTSALTNYPIDPFALTAKDFIAGDAAEEPNFDIETSGSQTIIKATEGPVKFISNYKALFDKEKMGDFTNWFYHDVSWGPEIGALSSINFLSGVQSDNGKTTLGYHTTSREGSTIIMSPDVPFDWNKQIHIDQSIAFYVIKNYLQPFADEDSSNGIESYIEAMFPDYVKKDNEKSYVALQHSKVFQSTFLKMYKKSYFMQAPVVLSNGQIAIDDNGILIPSTTGVVNPSAVNIKGIEMIELFRASLKNINTILNSDEASSTDKAKYEIVRQALIQNLFGDIEFTNTFQIKMLGALLGSDDDFIDGITNINAYTVGTYAGESENAKGFNSLTKKIMSLYDQAALGSEFHLRTQDSLVAYETKEEKVKETLNSLLVTSALADKTTKEDKIGAVLSVLAFYYSFNGMVAKDIFDGKHNLNYGDSSLQHTYDMLETMPESDIDNIDCDWIYSTIFPNYQVGEYTIEDIQQIKNLFVKFSNEDMTQLSQDLDKRIHPGKNINGKRTPGLPVYKSENERDDGLSDSFYDSITRRISQDMLYTISHEYGHHTTMWYAQDISNMNSPQSVLENSDPTGTEKSRGVVPNSQVITLPGLDSYADAGKYYMFRNAFSSTSYREVLDKTTDGDSKTDMTHQSYKTDFTVDGKIVPVDSDEGGIEGFTLLASSFEPLFLGATSTVKFGEVMEGNSIGLDLLQRVVKDGEAKVDPTKPVKEYDINYWKEISDFLKANTSITNDDQFRDYIKTYITRSLVDSNLFGSDISAYKSGQVYDDETKKPLYISADGKTTTTESIGPNGEPLKPYIGNPNMAIEGGTFGWYSSSTLAVKETNDVKIVLVNFIKTLSEAANDINNAKTLEDVISSFSVKDLELVISKLVQAVNTYEQVPKPTSNPFVFTDALQLYNMIGGDENEPLSNVVTELTPYIDKWSLKTQPQADPKFTAQSTANFEGRVFARANHYLDELNKTAEFKLRNVTGEMVLRSYYEITGETTKTIFEKMFDTSDFADVTKVIDANGKEHILDNFMPTIEEKVAFFSSAIKQIVEEGRNSPTFADFKASLDQPINIVVNNVNLSFKLSSETQKKIADEFESGGSVFTFKNGVSGVGAVAYTFTDPNDIVKYKHHFTTVKTGSMPPESFYRYTSTYVEGLTRSWNQLAFAVNPELLTSPGEFYDGDPARYASEGEAFYNLQSADGITPADEEINNEGKKLQSMFARYYNTDKTISAMLRDRATGLYSFLGYTDVGATHINGLVFTKPNEDGSANANNFVSEVDAIYGVDNYHYYTKHGDASTLADFTNRESFMTKFSVLGNFENSKLKQGTYDVWKWIDENKDGKVQTDELMPIKNNEIQNDGHMNNNGKSPDTAEIIGNPESSKPDADFRIKVGDIKV